MLFKIAMVGFILSAQVSANSNQTKLNSISTLNQFTFGSCNKEDLPQPYWKQMTKLKSQLFLMTGDNIYGDAKTMTKLLRKYQRQINRKPFQDFLKHTPIIGTWDDHDYGLNNSNSQMNKKAQRQRIFLDFILEPKNSPRRKRKGIYTSYQFGPVGKQVKFILFDTRYFRDTLVNGKKDILGKAQWTWFEDQIRNSTANIHFIVSSTTVFYADKKGSRGEEWYDYPESKKRLLYLLDKHNVSGPVFLTGDKHFSTYLEKKHNGKVYPEYVSSSLTHPSLPWGAMFKQILGGPRIRTRPNFGMVTIDWNNSDGPLIGYHIYSSRKGKRKNSYHLKLQAGNWRH